MSERTKRLKKLVDVQNQLKALHERRHATHIALAREAEEEAAEIARRFDAADGLGMLFPGVYHGRIAQAAERRTENLARAGEEAERVLAATLRSNVVEDSWRAAASADEREAEDRERHEEIGRRTALARRDGK